MPRRVVVAVLLGLVGAVATVPFAAGHLLPQRGYLLIGLAAFAGYSPYALAPVLGLAALVRQWPVATVLAVVLAGQAVVLGPAYVGDGPGDGTPLVVMTANVYFGETDAATVVRVVQDHRVDVLAVEELTPEAVGRLRAAGLDRLLPYSALAPLPSAQGAGLWSRRPLAAVQPWASTFASVAGDVEVDGTAVRLRVLHPPPPASADGVRVWQRDYDRFVAAARRETSGPTLLLGDFNASVHHRRLRELMGDRWRDAGEIAGAGLVRTWGPRIGRPEVLDPDHVLVDRGMGVARFATVELGRSDHRAVLATVVLATRR